MTAPFILTQTLGTGRSDFDGYVGFMFDTGTNTPTVTALGRWMINGNDQTHNLYLYQFVDGVGGDIQLGTVSVNLLGGTTSAYNYANLGSPITLSAGLTYYVISQEASGSDAWYNNDTAATSLSPNIGTITNGAFTGSLGQIATDGGVNSVFVPVNFLTTTGTLATVLIEGSDDLQIWNDFSNGGVTASVAKDLIPGIRYWRTNIVTNAGVVTSSVGAVPTLNRGTRGLNPLIRTGG